MNRNHLTHLGLASTRAVVTTVAALICTMNLGAQTTTATLRGYVKVYREPGKMVAGATLTVFNNASGYVHKAVARPDGSFSLTLDPASYTITVAAPGYLTNRTSIRVQVGQALDLDLLMAPEAGGSAVVQVTATQDLVEMKSAEVATNITPEQLEFLPQGRRSFLDFAALAPGIRLNTDENNQGFSSGGQQGQKVNVFIDGASYKSDLLKGGVAGQDSSRGNPFPTSAVQEFRVLTENYKAEYQKASAAIITASTKSGSNEFHGDLFTYFQDKNLVEKDYFAKKENRAKETYERLMVGASLGGPIIKDKVHFFVSFEQNRQDRDATVKLGDVPPPPSLATTLTNMQGLYASPFRSNLFFGKLDWQINDAQFLEFTANLRQESDKRGFGGQDSYQRGEDMKINVNSFMLKHRLSSANWLNEAMLNYQSFRWNPVSLGPDAVGINYGGVLNVGGRSTPSQDFKQVGTSLRDDFTYIGLEGHNIKVGAHVDFLDYTVIKQLNGNPTYYFESWYENWAMPKEADFGMGKPDLSATNKQFGIYLQDDWKVTPRLTLNLGVRWDYESDLFNPDYVTPAAIRSNATLLSLGLRDYMTDGSQRSAFKGAIQPRLGFSYDLTGKGKTVLFGGWGRYFDRESYNNTLDEKYRLQYPNYHFYFTPDGSDLWGNSAVKWDSSYLTKAGLAGLIASGHVNPEIFLLNNNTKPPHSDQISLGLRHTTGAVNYSLTYTNVRSMDNLVWVFGNRDANHQAIQVPGYGNVLINSTYNTWYEAIYVVVDRPYTDNSGWGVGASLTLANSKQTGINDDQPGFALNQGEGDPMLKHRSPGDEKARLVANAIVKLPWGFRLSGLLTLGSGSPYTGYNAYNGWGPGNGHFEYYTYNPKKYSFIVPNAWAYRSLDVKLQKDFTFGKSRLGINVEAINVMNYDNFTYGTWVSGLTFPKTDPANPKFGEPEGAMPGRRVFGLTYSF